MSNQKCKNVMKNKFGKREEGKIKRERIGDIQVGKVRLRNSAQGSCISYWSLYIIWNIRVLSLLFF
jgi:hypothetical protein